MKIYDLLIYDEIDIYLRNDNFMSVSKAQAKLSNWFVSEECTPDIAYELLTMSDFKTQDSSVVDSNRLISFKEFLANYYLDNPQVTKKIFNLIVAFAKEMGNFRHNIDTILSSEFCTEKEFNYMFKTEKYFGMYKESLNTFLSNCQLSEEALLNLIDYKVAVKDNNHIQFDIIIKTQILSKKVINHLIESDKTGSNDLIYLLGRYNHEIDIDLFFSTVENFDEDEDWENPSIGIKKIINRKPEIINVSKYWRIIDKCIKNFSNQNTAIIIYAILVISTELPEHIIKSVAMKTKALYYILDKMDIKQIHHVNRIALYNNTNISDFLPEDIANIFFL